VAQIVDADRFLRVTATVDRVASLSEAGPDERGIERLAATGLPHALA
jgi:hypothetical protein